MAEDVTPADVKRILDTDLALSSLEVWTNAAQSTVDDLKDTELNGDRKTVVMVLAAHYASTQDQRLSGGSEGDGQVSYQGTTEMGLKSTKYGQTALQLAPALESTTTQTISFESIG